MAQRFMIKILAGALFFPLGALLWRAGIYPLASLIIFGIFLCVFLSGFADIFKDRDEPYLNFIFRKFYEKPIVKKFFKKPSNFGNFLMVIIFLTAIYFLSTDEIKINKDTYYWLFSSMLQGFIAFISIFGFILTNYITSKRKMEKELKKDFASVLVSTFVIIGVSILGIIIADSNFDKKILIYCILGLSYIIISKTIEFFEEIWKSV